MLKLTRHTLQNTRVTINPSLISQELIFSLSSKVSKTRQAETLFILQAVSKDSILIRVMGYLAFSKKVLPT